jgi:hypothetical protein
MAEPEELIEKADALMARHRRTRTAADPPADIPVLTEVIALVPGADGLPVLTEAVSPEPYQPAQAGDPDAEAVSMSVRTALLDELQPEIDRQIEERLKFTLEPLVEKMFNDLRDDLQTISREILADAVKVAVEREIEQRKKDD